MGKVIGIIVVLALAVLFAVLTCKSKRSDLFKWVGIFLFIAFALTWVLPYGYFQGGSFYEYGMHRLGLTDVPNVLFYAVYFCLTTVLYLLVLGGFYGVLSKTKGYQALVKKFAKAITGKEIPVAVVLIVLLVALTSILRTPLALLIFIPFLVSVLLNAKFDKLTTMGLTFGSLLVGTLAATYGTDGLYWFNNYSDTAVTVGIKHRVVLGLVALALFIGYNIFRIVRNKKKNVKAKAEEVKDDVYAVEEVKGKVRIWPTIVLFAVLGVFLLLGYINWNANWNIEAFDKFHTWLTELSIGEDFTIFSYILGTNAVALGKFELSALIIILILASMLVGAMGKLKVSEFTDSFAEGLGKMIKPVILYVLTYAVFIVAYLTPVMTFITDWAFGLTSSFNPYIATFTAFVTSIFHADLGYTSYLVAGMLQSNFAGDFTLAHTIYVYTYGLVQVFAPTSGLLLIGLAFLKIDYKSWFKYIWIFALAMLIVLLVFATFVKYVF